MSVSAKLDVSLSLAETGSNAFSAGPYWTGVLALSQAFANGVGASQADLVYVAERTVASATNDDIDLAGVLADPLGNTVTAAELVALLIINKQKDGTANSTNLTIGAGSNPVVGFLGGTTPTIGPIRPGGVLLLASPDAAGIGAVTAGTGDILRIANSSGAQAKYLIGVLARTS
jgi:hypothetical protein